MKFYEIVECDEEKLEEEFDNDDFYELYPNAETKEDLEEDFEDAFSRFMDN